MDDKFFSSQDVCAVSLGALSGRKMDNVAKGISAAAALKKLKGAALTTPVAVSCVVTQDNSPRNNTS